MARKGRLDRGLVQRKDATGKLIWRVRLYHDGRERQFGSFPSKTKAREFYEKAKLEQKDGRFFPERYQIGGHATLAEVLEQYIATFTGRSMRDEKRFALKWKTLCPGMRINQLTPAFLEQKQIKLNKEGRTPQTTKKYMTFLRRVLYKVVRDGKLTSNPVARMKLHKETTGRTRFLSPEEEAQLMGALGPEYGRWARVAILTGMRQGEQFHLK